MVFSRHAMLLRRQALQFGAAALLPFSAWASAKPKSLALKRIAHPEPIAQVAAGGPTGLLGVGASGVLWALALEGSSHQRLGDELDPDTPLAVGHGRVAGRRSDAALWVYEARRSAVSAQRTLAPHAGMLVLPLAIIAVVTQGGQHRLARFEPSGTGNWRSVAQSAQDVLPDARPLQADLDGSGDDGQVVVLAGPDGERYPHGVLGDTIEATRVVLLERHSLALMRECVLQAPFVFEDIAPRKVSLGTRDGLLTVQSGPQGGQLVLVDADPKVSAALRVMARGPALGTRNRWMSPLAQGEQWLAVHTPHIGGVLHSYRREGSLLVSQQMQAGVSNHRIGSRMLNMSAWLGTHLLIPDQSGRRLLLLSAAAQGHIMGELALASRVVAMVSLEAVDRVAVVFEDGGVGVATISA